MAKVTCFYYVSETGRSPVEEFIDGLDIKSQQKFFFVKSLLEEFGFRLPQPHAKYIGDDIFELRFKGMKGAIRILYFFFHKDQAVFTNGFVKKSDKTPQNEKHLAMERRKIFMLIRARR